MEKKMFNVIAALMIILLVMCAAGMVKNVDSRPFTETMDTAAEK